MSATTDKEQDRDSARPPKGPRQLGLSGTPILIRDDGAIRYGMLPPEELDAWRKGAE